MTVTATGALAETRVQIRPRWPLRLSRRSGMDGLSPVRGGVLHRLLHLWPEQDPQITLTAVPDAELVPVHVRVAQLACGDLLIGARSVSDAAADDAIRRMRRALGVDLDLKPFHDRFAGDPWIGAALRANPTLRLGGRAVAFESLAWAVTEQLIEYERAAAIQRRLVAATGRHSPQTGLRDSPSAAGVAAVSPARLESFDLAGKRALALRRVATLAAGGRVNLDSSDPDVQARDWQRLRAIPEIGSWTTEILACSGQGRLDQLPAGDLGYIKLIGRVLSDGDPRARATEEQVRAVFERFGEWKGLAGAYALRAAHVHKTSVGA